MANDEHGTSDAKALTRNQRIVEPDKALARHCRGPRERIFDESEVVLNPLNQRLADFALVRSIAA